MQAYSPHKIVHFPDTMRWLREGRQPNPIHVQIIPTNRCNHRCSFCAYRMKGYLSAQNFNQKDEMSREKLLEVISSSGVLGADSIQITGGGEPLLHPNIQEAMETILFKGMDLGVVTNGSLVTPELARVLSQASWVRISLDAGTDFSYAKIRGVPKAGFDRVLGNISLIAKEPNRHCELGVGFVLNNSNFMDVVDAAMKAREAGADNFRISAAFTTEGAAHYQGIVETCRAFSNRAKLLETGNFKVHNFFDVRTKDLNEIQDYPFCGMKEISTYIGADLNVYSCCTLAYNDKGLIGSIREQTLEQLWESSDKKRMFALHDPRKICRHGCLYRVKNEFINYCLDPAPKHVGFV